MIPICHAGLTKFKAGPDQVLVLYNEDYDIDVDGSLPGQDSKEVAQYYIDRHTDPETGKKPYLLGLKCRHGKKHLNDWVIREKSNDNKNGIEYTRGKGGPQLNEWARDSRFVELNIQQQAVPVDWETIDISCRSEKTKTEIKIAPKISGLPARKGRQTVYPEIKEGGGRCYRFNAKEIFSGTVWVFVKVKDHAGKVVKNLKLKYYDTEDFKFSILGQDEVPDELHFQEDVAIPVKEFLEDNDNILPDGTVLKEHILYIVICHGLPFSCEGVFGIERGVTSKQSNHGDLGSLEQRLQTLYYEWGTKIIPPVISMYMSGGPDSKAGVKNHRITSAMRYPMTGNRWNPYMHPDTYSFLSKKDAAFIDLPPLPLKRKQLPQYFFAYGVSRLDGQGPTEAKRQIDYSLYGSKYLHPDMDIAVRKLQKKEDAGNLTDQYEKIDQDNVWGVSEEEALGFRVLSYYGGQGIPFLGRSLEDHYQIESPLEKTDKPKWSGYYPGGMDRAVYSGNGWNMGRGASIWRQVDNGVTISACGGPAYGGGPHITNATFWDNRILLRYLLRGRDLGECFLLSTLYVNWSTSLVGDPLYHPDLSQTIVDKASPRVRSKDDIKIKLIPVMGEYTGQLTIPIVSTKERPEVVTLELYYWEKDSRKENVSTWPIYSTRPKAILRNLEPDTIYFYRPVLRDPYGNVADVSKGFGPLQFKTGSKPETEMLTRNGKKSDKHWQINLLKRKFFSESGTLEVMYSSTSDGILPVVRSKEIQVGAMPGASSHPFKIGGPSRGRKKKAPTPKGDDITMILRWRRFPLTRELLFKAKNGKEFTYAADVRTPWVKMTLKDPIRVSEQKHIKIHSVKLFNDAFPASEGACALSVSKFDTASWAEAHR
ncbi:hypothetical protein [Desulfobacula sp.]|uniref:hypothetical protein n=1 Tax=Desulfobacula sp. TaxID=2593537 RepID=UPI0026290B88|nr:hypothetical protein [Desulfobacula sp.]